MNGKKQFRHHTNASRLWVAAEELWPPFSNQMVIEGSGSIDPAELQKAVKEASQANPGSRLLLKGMPWKRKWIDSGQTPPLRVVDGSAWSGYDMNGAPFLLDRLNIDSGPSCEVLFITGRKIRIAFRTHHAVMDGRGTATWAEDIFRVLRGEKPFGSEYITTEDDLLNLSKKTEKTVSGRYLSLTGKPGTGEGFTWFRKKIEGSFTDLLPSVMMLSAAEAWRHGDGKIRIGIPVDLRGRRNGLRSTGNLTNAVFFNIDKDTTKTALRDQIKKRINEQLDGVLTWEDHIVKFIPRSILKAALAREAEVSRKTGLYRYSAIISNMGKIPLQSFNTNIFNTEFVFFIPPGNELSPFFIGLHGTTGGLEIYLTVPSGFNKDGRVDDMLNRLIAGLKADSLVMHA